MKIAVTGGSGQIGVPLITELIKQGHSVRALIHNRNKGLENLPIEFVNGNTLNPTDCDNLCKEMDAVFHLAAIVSINGDPDGKVMNINVNGTKNMLDACVKHKIQKMVHFSSIHAYDTQPTNEPLDETRAFAGENAFPYERSKATAQKMVHEYATKHNLNVSIINPTGVLGFPDYLPSIKGKLLIDFYNGKIPVLVPGGFDWVDVRDVVKTAISALHNGKAGESYLTSGKYYSVKDFAAIISKITGKKTPKTVAPLWLLNLSLPFISLYGKVTKTEPLYTSESLKSLIEGNKTINNQKAQEQLGHTVRPIEETLTDSYAWLKENNFIK
ncbi:MAG TPA: NAD-dependent epimerase/dehydratase family protein [Crocinitomicaceae bacterium]|nr:NAD-dependent epimerase/dehydratase family protein [Crocinitomicaceae bacterium]